MPAGLTGGRTYYWRVRALDGANTGSFSNGAMFKVVIPVIIEPPVPMSPVGDATTANRSPALVVRNTAVTGPAGAVTYYFQIATDAGFANVVFNGSAPRTGGESTSLQLPELRGRHALLLARLRVGRHQSQHVGTAAGVPDAGSARADASADHADAEPESDAEPVAEPRAVDAGRDA